MKSPPVRRRPRLLVVEGVPASRQRLAALLSGEDYAVATAATASESLQLTQIFRWDGVILDLDLRDMNGMELYVRLEEANGAGLLPVVYCSARRCEQLEQDLRGLPWARLVSKSCGDLQLLATLRQCFQADKRLVPAGVE